MLSKIIRRLVHSYNRIRLRNTEFSLITNTCIGGIIYHELRLPFLSPIINCGILEHDEFITFLRNMEHYLSLPLDFIPSKRNYPVAVLHGEMGDVTVHFAHYHTEKDAQAKWEVRKKRIRWDNLFVLMDGDNCSDIQVRDFDNLPIKNKVVITMKNYPECPSSFAILRKDYVQGEILKYGLLRGTIRWFELFDIVHFFNTGKIRKNAFFRNR